MTTHHARKASPMLVPTPPLRSHSHGRLGSAAVGAVLAALALTACGSDTPDSAATASAAPSGAPSGAPDAAAFQEIRACLEAAGLDPGTSRAARRRGCRPAGRVGCRVALPVTSRAVPRPACRPEGPAVLVVR